MKKKKEIALLKAEISELKQDIRTLVSEPDSVDAAIIRGRYKISKQMEEAIMFGVPPSAKKLFSFGGLETYADGDKVYHVDHGHNDIKNHVV